ncbi:MAG: glycosyltransferase [Halanaerobiales bacterium]|nr:glycosyltransferase [Halanaerobiales bacterium]
MFFPITEDAYKWYGGLEIRTLSLVKHLSDKGYEVNVYAPRGSELKWKNVTIYSGNFPMWDGKQGNPYELEKDLINSNLSSLKECDAICEDNHFHYLNYIHSKEQWKNQALMSWDFYLTLNALPSNPRNVVCVSKWLRNGLREKLKNRGHHFYYAYSGLNLDLYREYIKNISFDGPILFLNRFSTIKGGHLFLQLVKDFPDKKFLMLGDSLFANENVYVWKLKQQVNGFKNVHMILNASWEEKIKALQTCKFLVHPCLVDEPLGLDVLEAQYFGKYVLGFGMGGLLETVKDDKTGKLLPFNRDISVAYANLRNGFTNLLQKKENPLLCRKNIEKNFDFKKLSAPVYEAIINKKSEDEIFEMQKKQNGTPIK